MVAPILCGANAFVVVSDLKGQYLDCSFVLGEELQSLAISM